MSAQSPAYLDIQAEVGITKHLGGFKATDDLLKLCHVKDANNILYVGSGIGVGPAYIARTVGCHVVAVDISEKMLSWTMQRAKEEGVSTKVETRLGTILALPFEDNSFDAVLVESVLAFVDNKGKAIKECLRVIHPGGYIGLNEVYWSAQPSAEMIEANRRIQMGIDLLLFTEWQKLWESIPLSEKRIKTYIVEMKSETKDRLQWVGWRWSLRAVGRLIRLYFSNPLARQAIKSQTKETALSYKFMGFGLFIGQK